MRLRATWLRAFRHADARQTRVKLQTEDSAGGQERARAYAGAGSGFFGGLGRLPASGGFSVVSSLRERQDVLCDLVIAVR